jgi:hypothetical protein
MFYYNSVPPKKMAEAFCIPTLFSWHTPFPMQHIIRVSVFVINKMLNISKSYTDCRRVWQLTNFVGRRKLLIMVLLGFRRSPFTWSTSPFHAKFNDIHQKLHLESIVFNSGVTCWNNANARVWQLVEIRCEIASFTPVRLS